MKAAGKVVQNPGRGRGAPPARLPLPALRGGRGAPPPLPFEQRDIIHNGADDDGSGSTALLAIAKAFATGPKPKRSVVFVWHAGEEAGLQGSRFNADFPVVPLDKVQAVLNMDMVGRDDCDNLEGDYTNSVFLVGADRISTDLHNLIVRTNAVQARPLTLDYELNDPLDPENIYTRSDHYSYAREGHSGRVLHHRPAPRLPQGHGHGGQDPLPEDGQDRAAGLRDRVFDRELRTRVLERDNKGPRTGYGSKAEVIR